MSLAVLSLKLSLTKRGSSLNLSLVVSMWLPSFCYIVGKRLELKVEPYCRLMLSLKMPSTKRGSNLSLSLVVSMWLPSRQKEAPTQV